jgi:hypothetical protein
MMSTPHHRHNERRLERLTPKSSAGDADEPSIVDWAQAALQEHPYAALAVAVGIGFALGQGRATRLLIRPIFSAGMRVAVPALLAPIAAAIARKVNLGADDHDSATAKEKRP